MIAEPIETLKWHIIVIQKSSGRLFNRFRHDVCKKAGDKGSFYARNEQKSSGRLRGRYSRQ